MKKYFSRKFLIALIVGAIVYLNPEADVKELCTILGLPGLFIIIEGLRDIVAAWKENKDK